MELREVYKKTKERLKEYQNSKDVTNFREEQIYFTALVMGIVAKSDKNYDKFKAEELEKTHSDRYKQGIIDAESINMTDNIIFEAMSYNEEIIGMLPIKKKEQK